MPASRRGRAARGRRANQRFRGPERGRAPPGAAVAVRPGVARCPSGSGPVSGSGAAPWPRRRTSAPVRRRRPSSLRRPACSRACTAACTKVDPPPSGRAGRARRGGGRREPGGRACGAALPALGGLVSRPGQAASPLASARKTVAGSSTGQNQVSKRRLRSGWIALLEARVCVRGSRQPDGAAGAALPGRGWLLGSRDLSDARGPGRRCSRRDSGRSPGSSLDLEQLRSAFDVIVAFGWNALGLHDPDGPHVYVEGVH